MIHDVTVRFANRKAAEHFATWLLEQGESDYHIWMEFREEEESTKDMTAIGFTRDGTRLQTTLITTKCGRLDE